MKSRDGVEPREPICLERASGARWEDLCGLFGRAGASNGCWCQYWLLGPEYHRRNRTINQDSLRRECAHGRSPGPGLMAYRDGHAVGWARLSPRSELGWLNQRFAGRLPDSDDPWSLSCFYVPNRYRGAGVMTILISAAVTAAREAGVTIEAYPVDPTIEGATRNRFTGVLEPFLRAGFIEVVRLTPDRAVVQRTC